LPKNNSSGIRTIYLKEVIALGKLNATPKYRQFTRMPVPSVKLGFAAGSINLGEVTLVAEVISHTIYNYDS
jgi:hypothetical protein